MNHGSQLAVRRLRLLFLYSLVLSPIIAVGAMRALELNSNSPIEWTPASFPPRVDYDRFVDKFGPGDAVMLSWDGCTLDNRSLDPLLQVLRHSNSFKSATGEWLFHQLICGREVVHALTTSPRPLSEEEAVDRLRGSLIGPDGRTTAVVATLTSEGLRRRQRVVGLMEDAVVQVCGVSRDAIHRAGPAIDGLSVDEAGKTSLDRFAFPSAAIILVIACLSLRNWRVGLLVFGLSVYCQAATLALLYFSGATMSAVLIVLPPLIQVLAVSGGVHLVNYYTEALPSHGPRGAAWEAVRLGWLPCLLSLGTTALGIGSLAASKLTPIHAFGVFGAAGAIITAGLLLSVIPAALYFWPPHAMPSRPKPRRPTGHAGPWIALTALLTRHHRWVLLTTAVLILACGAGLPRVQTSVRIETLFSPQSRLLRDYRWMEQHVGALAPIEVVLFFPDQTPAGSQLEKVETVRAAIRRLPGVQATLTPADLMADLPAADQFTPEVYEEMRAGVVDEARDAWVQAGRLALGDDGQYWRITAYLSALAPLDYGQFLQSVRAVVDPLLKNDSPQKAATATPISAEYAGIMPLVHEIQRQLLRDLLVSFGGAFVVITLVMTLANGSIMGGMVMMLPNLLPIVMLFGLLGWSGLPVEIGAVMTASIALGIAVDDTLHFLTFFHRGMAQTGERSAAVLFAYRHCGKAMIQTSVTCGCGLLVFALSDFVPTSRFAVITAVLLAVALLADLVITPAILLSPLGAFLDGAASDAGPGDADQASRTGRGAA